MSTVAYETNNDLPEGVREIALHRLFDEVHAATTEYADLLAERVVQLGGVADGPDHVGALGRALAGFGAGMRRSIDETDNLGDRCGADICTEISRGIDKWPWFVEAHVQASPMAIR